MSDETKVPTLLSKQAKRLGFKDGRWVYDGKRQRNPNNILEDLVTIYCGCRVRKHLREGRIVPLTLVQTEGSMPEVKLRWLSRPWNYAVGQCEQCRRIYWAEENENKPAKTAV